MEKGVILLGIESSCDDTSAAVSVDDKILANVTASQDIHSKYGGVVPELASRAHQKHIIPVVDAALKEAGVTADRLDAIAYTLGPGLLGSLLVGSSFAKSMAQALGIPAIPIHHMKAHVLAHFIDLDREKPTFPFICLTVSGGHTQLLRVDGFDEFTVLGETLDDAAGEAFDKAAKYLGLPYPGGPEIDRLAEGGDPDAHVFTKPKVDGYNFSFSGLKTGFVNYVDNQQRTDPQFPKNNLEDLAASLRKTIVDMLMDRLVQVAEDENISTIAIAGGVSANRGLRRWLNEVAEERDWKVFIPPLEYCTDNGAMIAIAGYYEFLMKRFGKITDAARARWKMESEA